MADFTINNNIITNLNSHKTNNDKEYLNLSEFKLVSITDVYEQINQSKEIYFLDENNKPLRVKSIAKEDYKGKIYDVTVDNPIILVKRGNSSAIWSGNSYNNSNGSVIYDFSSAKNNGTSITGASGQNILNMAGEAGSFNWTGSQTAWANVPQSNTTVIDFFNYTDATDTAEMDVYVEVPPGEGAGVKTSQLVFTGWYVREI